MTGIKMLMARTIGEIEEIVRNESGDIRFLAGGTDLMVGIQKGLDSLYVWIDITSIENLKGIEERNASVFIGSLTTISEIATSPMLREYAPSLVRSAGIFGSPQIRNRATIGGNVGNASPAGDTIPPLYIAEATVIAALGSRERKIPIEYFFKGPGTTCLERGELIIGFVIPKRPDRREIYLRFAQRKSLAISKVSIAVGAGFEGGKIDDPEIALGAVGPTIIRARRTEMLLSDGKLSDSLVKKAMISIADEAAPQDDVRSTTVYRREMSAVLLKRALEGLARGFD